MICMKIWKSWYSQCSGTSNTCITLCFPHNRGNSASCRVLFCFPENRTVFLTLLFILHTENLTFIAATIISSLFWVWIYFSLLFLEYPKGLINIRVYLYPVFQGRAAFHLGLVIMLCSIYGQTYQLPAKRGWRKDTNRWLTKLVPLLIPYLPCSWLAAWDPG